MSVPPASEGWMGFGLRFMETVKCKKDTGAGAEGGGHREACLVAEPM